MRHFDAHAYRTEDADGVWDFARGCMRTYLILADKAAPLPRGRRDPGRAARGARPTALAEPTRPAGGLDEHPRRPTLRRGRARRAGLRPRAARPARHRAAARRALSAPGRRRRLVDVGVQGRGPRRRHRRARRAGPRAAPADDAAAQRAGPAATGGRRSRPRARRPACSVAHRPAAIAVAGQQHGLVVLDADGDGAPPGEAVERHRVGARRGGARRRARAAPRRGPRRAAACRSPLHDHQARAGCGAASPRCSRRIAAVLLPARLADRRSSPARRRPIGATRRAPATGRRPRSATGSTCSRSSTTTVDWDAVLPEVLGAGRGRRRVGGRARSSAPGTGDNMAAALGLGLRPGDLALSLGTSGTAFAVSDQPDRRSQRARSPASPTPPAASSRSCARSTPPR